MKHEIGATSLLIICVVLVFWLHYPRWKEKERIKREKREEEIHGKLR